MEACPQLLDLIPKDAEWLKSRDKDRSHGSSEEKKLELRLGPPGEHWSVKDTSKSNKKRDESLLSLGYFSSIAHKNNVNNGDQNYKFSSSQQNPVGCILSSPWSSSCYQKSIRQTQQQTKAPSFLQFPSVPHQSLPVVSKEASQICGSKGIELQSSLSEKKVFSKSPANTAVPNTSQKRTAPASVVGWPPIRSFRKNISSSSSKPSNESQTAVQNKGSGGKTVESCRIGMFVKINMDGVPIGRKVDLKAYDNYEKLSSSVDKLFRDLLAAQKDSSAGGIRNEEEEKKEIKGVLDGSGEYTLVYEDNEGDRMLVGDVPWHMFVSTVKRLRVLKSSELPMLSLGSKQDKIPVNSKMEEEEEEF